jgi:hypothetical protein
MPPHQATQPKRQTVAPKPRRARTYVEKTGSGEFKVALKANALKAWRAAQKTRVTALMETLGVGLDESRRHGRPTRFLIVVDADGQPTIQAAEANGAVSDPDDLDAALAAARARGQKRAAEILAGDEMLSTEAFAEHLGISPPTVHAKRQKHEVLALDGAKRGFRFPAWQLDENGKPFAALPRLFEELGDSPWTVYRFLIQHHGALGGATGVQLLRSGQDDALVEAAEGLKQGTFA